MNKKLYSKKLLQVAKKGVECVKDKLIEQLKIEVKTQRNIIMIGEATPITLIKAKFLQKVIELLETTTYYDDLLNLNSKTLIFYSEVIDVAHELIDEYLNIETIDEKIKWLSSTKSNMEYADRALENGNITTIKAMLNKAMHLYIFEELSNMMKKII